MSWWKKVLNVALRILTAGKNEGWFDTRGGPS